MAFPNTVIVFFQLKKKKWWKTRSYWCEVYIIIKYTCTTSLGKKKITKTHRELARTCWETDRVWFGLTVGGFFLLRKVTIIFPCTRYYKSPTDTSLALFRATRRLVDEGFFSPRNTNIYESRDTLKSLSLFLFVKTISKLNIDHSLNFKIKFSKSSVVVHVL